MAQGVPLPEVASDVRDSRAGRPCWARSMSAVAAVGSLSAVRAELHGSGVQISLVVPGVVETELAAGTVTGPVRRLAPPDVAQAVLALVVRPRFEISLPRRIGFLTRLAAVLPDRARFRLQRALVPDQVAAVTDKSVRRSYESRTVTDDRLEPGHGTGDNSAGRPADPRVRRSPRGLLRGKRLQALRGQPRLAGNGRNPGPARPPSP